MSAASHASSGDFADSSTPGRPVTMRIVQNVFLPEQIEACKFEPYLNASPEEPDERYLFLESDVIRRLVQDRWHVGHDYFGVLGPRWEAKLDEARSWRLPIRNVGRETPTPEGIVALVRRNPRADFISLGRFLPHPVFRVADRIHPGLMEATSRLLDGIGVRCDLRSTVPHPIYFNSFLARRDVVEAYVRDLLAPVIDAATHDPALRGLCFRDAGYRHPFPDRLRDLYGLDYYPLHPFIGERLVNAYVLLSGARVASFDGGGGAGFLAGLRGSTRSATLAIRGHWELWRRWR